MLPQQGNNDVVEHKLTRKLKDKIVAYMIVLALHVDGFSIEYEVIAKDLKYVAHELGGGGPPDLSSGHVEACHGLLALNPKRVVSRADGT